MRLDNIISRLDHQAEILAVPVRDIPTVDELLEQAKSDPVARKALQNTMAELEFESTEIEYN